MPTTPALDTAPTRPLPAFAVHAIDPGRLDAIRQRGYDEHGNAVAPFAAGGGEPLRCCLRVARAGEGIALISYSPFTAQSPWRETGPVYVHADRCAGYTADAGLPDELRTGPRILRTYGPDGALAYDHITLVPEGDDLEPYLTALLATPSVTVVHVRALLAQCFTYAVTPATQRDER